jgi:hypothetical protein
MIERLYIYPDTECEGDWIVDLRWLARMEAKETTRKELADV